MRLLAGSACGVGYLLKDRSATSETSSIGSPGRPRWNRDRSTERVGVDHETASRRPSVPPDRAGARVLALMAEGRSNQGIAEQCHINLRSVEKNVSSVFTKLTCRPTRLTPSGCSQCSCICAAEAIQHTRNPPHRGRLSGCASAHAIGSIDASDRSYEARTAS